MNNRSIRFQLRICISLVLVIAFSSISVVVYKNTSTIFLEQTMKAHQSKLEALAEMISDEFNVYLESTRQMEKAFRGGYLNGLSFGTDPFYFSGHAVKDVRLNGQSLINNSAVIDRFTQDTSAIATLFVATGDDFIRVSTSLKDQNGNRAIGTMLGRSHPGYNLLSNGQPYHAKVELFGHLYLTYYFPIKDSVGSVKALSFVGIPIEAVTQSIFSTLADVKWGDTGYSIVMDNAIKNQGEILYHPLAAEKPKSILDFTDYDGNKPFGKLFEHKTGVMMYPYHYLNSVGEKYLVYTDVPGWNWKLAGGTFISEVTKGSREILFSIVTISFVVTVLTLIAINVFIHRLTKPLVSLVRGMERLGDGEISMAMEGGHADTKNEIERLSYATSTMATKLNRLVNNIRKTSDSVQQQAVSVSDEARANLSQSEVQQAQVEQVATAIEELAASAQSVAEQVEEIADNVQTANEDSNSGSALVRKVVSDVESLNHQLGQTAEVIETLSRESDNIQAVTNMINDIAEQTNLLALNAAIEAARAGEQGRGFAVVADEVRSLAQRTQGSVKDVVAIIEQLKINTSSAVEMMSESQLKGTSVTRQVAQAGEMLDNIASQVDVIAVKSEAIAATSEEQAHVTQDIAMSVNEISSLNKSNYSTTEKTAERASQLKKLSVDLANQVAYFR
ncbi:methyl-accepting chemotaxis protein [Photobacterium alginatilyticum]|uniref:Methyl-accepting chemotaxis protein n=1 Tax=Photobacterium alginatilyticum TaxID=1775171 RepID=A0ABW9YBU2_9GAMM|nr:methyl-accepting chemotaxis protein [Photobacterium alginatilyticum]NBI51237.1 methyl-accepting chemotaxis protein [Photobacterium alginatilyticum]